MNYIFRTFGPIRDSEERSRLIKSLNEHGWDCLSSTIYQVRGKGSKYPVYTSLGIVEKDVVEVWTSNKDLIRFLEKYNPQEQDLKTKEP